MFTWLILYISGIFTESWRGLNYTQGRLADVSRPLIIIVGRSNWLCRPLTTIVGRSTWPRWLAGRTGYLPIVPTGDSASAHTLWYNMLTLTSESWMREHTTQRLAFLAVLFDSLLHVVSACINISLNLIWPHPGPETAVTHWMLTKQILCSTTTCVCNLLQGFYPLPFANWSRLIPGPHPIVMRSIQ